MHVGSGSLFMCTADGPDERSRTTATRRSVIYRNVDGLDEQCGAGGLTQF